MSLPKPRIVQRKIDALRLQQFLAAGLPELLCRILAARPSPKDHPLPHQAILNPKLADLDSPQHLKDLDVAVERIVKAIVSQEIIALETDHDCDGQTAQAVLLSAFRDIFGLKNERLQTYIGHRLKEGYGLSDALVERILRANPRPTLVITADNGSSDELRIARLKAEGIEVIVTDHHEIPAEGLPHSALACLNPTRTDCPFPDTYIAGCMVAWLLMAAVRKRLMELNYPVSTQITMRDLLDFVAVGTVADCVSLARSVNNRAVVKYGLQLIQAAKRPCWQALLPLLNKPHLSAQDLGFVVAPLLNSDGRLSDAMGSMSFLLSDTLEQAGPWAEELWKRNQHRKKIQAKLTEQAVAGALKQVEAGRQSIVIFLEEGHAGVHGISASRIKEAFGRPCVLFSTKQGEELLISGSARSVDEIHIRQALQAVADAYPGLMLKFGGHRGAAGLLIQKQNFDQFSVAFEQAVLSQLGDLRLEPMIQTDGELALSEVSLETVELLRQLEPLGREFEPPVFEITAKIMTWRLVGQDMNHAQLTLQLSDQKLVSGIWFNALDGFEIGQTVRAVVQLTEHVSQKVSRLQVQVFQLFKV